MGGIARRKLMDRVFVIVGLCALVAALAVLLALFIDLVVQGAPRRDMDFLTSFASRKPGQAGILAAWVGTALIMLVTACIAMPVGVAAAIYLEEYAPKNAFTAIIEINVTNLAGVPSIIYGLLALGLFVQIMGISKSLLAGGLTPQLVLRFGVPQSAHAEPTPRRPVADVVERRPARI